MTTFTPPIVDGESLSQGGNDPASRLMRHFGSVKVGETVWRDGSGVFHQGQYPYQDNLSAATRVYLGGHVHDITSAEASDLTAAGYGDRINIAPVTQLTVDKLSDRIMTLDGTNVPATPIIDPQGAFTGRLASGSTVGTSNRRDFWLISDTEGWTDSHGIVEFLDPPNFGTFDGTNILPQNGVALRVQFNEATGKWQGITLNHGVFLGLPILNVGAWHALPDGTSFTNRQFSWPLEQALNLPYGYEYHLADNIVRIRLFPKGQAPDTTPWSHPTLTRTLNLDTDCGSTAVVPTPVGPGTNAIISAHLGTSPLSQTRVKLTHMTRDD